MYSSHRKTENLPDSRAAKLDACVILKKETVSKKDRAIMAAKSSRYGRIEDLTAFAEGKTFFSNP